MDFSVFSYRFIQNALMASILASVVCGIMGVIIGEKKLVMMSGGIAHTSYGGVGLGYFLGIEPIIGAFVISILAALGVAHIRRKGGTESDVIIGLLWSLGMALGIMFITVIPGYPPNISSYLFGNILAVTKMDLWLMAAITGIVVISVVMLFDYWKSFMFDGEFAQITGMKVHILEYLLFLLIAMSVVVLIRVAGIVLVMALFTAPTAIAGLLTKNFKKRMVISVLFGILFCLLGLYLSYMINVPSGAAIVILAFITYMAVYIFKNVKGVNKVER